MIIERGRGRDIIVRGRNTDGKRYEKTISGYWPYCFVRTEEDKYLDSVVKKEPGYVGLYGEKLTKIVCASPFDIKKISDDGDTWEANIPYTNRVLSDYINDGNKPIENYRHRTWYMDCEWSPTTNKLRVIVVYDNFTDKEYVWFVKPSVEGLKEGHGEPHYKYGEYEYDTPALAFENERSMLIHFIKHRTQT